MGRHAAMKWVIGVLLCAIHVWLAAFFIRARPREIVVHPIKKPPVLPKIQRERVDEFIRIAGSATDIDDASKSLDDYKNEAVQITLSSATERGGAADSLSMLNAVLADRRVSRLYGLLKQLPPDVAAAKCRLLFNEKLDRLIQLWLRCAPAYQTAQSQVTAPPIFWAQHSVRSTVFLCLMMCPASELEDVCRDWAERMQQAVSDSGFDEVDYERRTRTPLNNVFPDELFVANILAVIAERNGCGLVNSKGHSILMSVPRVRRPSYTWDRRPDGDDASDGPLVNEITCISGWGSIPRDRASQLETIEQMKESLVTCGVFKGRSE